MMSYIPYSFEAHEPMIGQPHWTIDEYNEKKKIYGVHLAAHRYGVESENDLQVIRDLISEIGMRDAEIRRMKKAVSS